MQSTSARGAHSEQIAAVRQELREIDARLAGLAGSRGAPIIEADIAALHVDWRWQTSKFCAEPTTAATRQFCREALRLQAELAASRDRDV